MSRSTASNIPGRWRIRRALVAVIATMLAAAGLVAAPTSATADVETGQWYVIESAHSGLVFDIADQSTDPGALLTQNTRSDGQNQQFRFLDSGNGYYRIQARHSAMVLDVYQWNADNGADIAQWDDLNGTNQQWQVRENADGTVTFINRFSGKALDLWNWSTAPGARISQYNDNGLAVQRWYLHPTS